MKIISILLIVISFYVYLVSVNFEYYDEIKHKRVTYTINIPGGYFKNLIYFDGTGTNEREDVYYYNDSSLIYICNTSYFQNYENILLLNDSVSKLRLLNRKLLFDIQDLLLDSLPQTLSISSIDKDSLYWRDYMVENISCGYKNVKPERKAIYDTAIETFQLKP